MSASATAAAWVDVYTIADEWEAGSCGTADGFLARFSATLTILESFPRLYGRVSRPPRGREIRVARISQTMYLAAYEVRGDHATVFAVGHAHLRNFWRGRL